MYALLESVQRSQPAVIDRFDAPDFEDILRAHAHTISLAFTPFEVNNRYDDAWLLLAGCFRTTIHERGLGFHRNENGSRSEILY
jgi:hypothetical protein